MPVYAEKANPFQLRRGAGSTKLRAGGGEVAGGDGEGAGGKLRHGAACLRVCGERRGGEDGREVSGGAKKVCCELAGGFIPLCVAVVLVEAHDVVGAGAQVGVGVGGGE